MQDCNIMSRPVKNGQYVVPPEILALKPSGISCVVKSMKTSTKSSGVKIHYYVYELTKVKGGAEKESVKVSSGACIGKIEAGAFCPNSKGLLLLKGLNHNIGDNSSTTEITDNSNSDNCVNIQVDNSINNIAVNMNLNLKDIDLQVKDYGEYAIVLESTRAVFEQLNKFFSVEDSKLIYALSIIYFIQEYTPASYIKDVFDQSVLANKWPNLKISENSVNNFLKLIGQHPIVCEKYSQGLIEKSSGMTAIDGHVILSCSKQNDLADYGNKYSKIGNKQINILEAYDVIQEVPLTSKAYEGGLLDKTSVQDLLESYNFPSNTTFLIDAGFYSEDDMKLYRKEGKHFIIPVPDSCVVCKAAKEFKAFDNSFVYEKRDEDGVIKKDRILYCESTVSELEDLYQVKLNQEAEKKSEDAKINCAEGEKARKIYPQKVKRSEFGDDRIIKFRDEEMHDKMVKEFREQIGKDDQHTEEILERLGPLFGVIVLRLNLSKETTASVAYSNYKKRWSIETHYNFVENIIRFYGLKTSDYYTMQGLSFIILVVGQIKSSFKKKQKSSSSNYVMHLSIKECLIKAARMKVSQHINKKWHFAASTQRTLELLKEMGVNITNDLTRLNSFQY